MTNKFDLPKELGLRTGRVRAILTRDYHKGRVPLVLCSEEGLWGMLGDKGARFSDCQDDMEGGSRIAFRLSPLPTGKIVLPGFILESLVVTTL